MVLLEKEKEGKRFELSSDALEELAREVAKKEVAAAKPGGAPELGVKSEMLQITIYSETFKELFKEENWHNILSFESIIGVKK